MPRKVKRRYWSVAILLLLMILPFVIERQLSYYTDGENLRESSADVGESLRDVLWEIPRVLGPEINAEHFDDYEPCMSPDGNILVFTRGRPGEGADLRVSERRFGRWSVSRSFTEMNSEADDLGAAFDAEGRRIFFYSDREGGLGGFDIWMSEVGDEGWSPPIPLGTSINSAWNEMSPAPDPRRGRLYFASDRKTGEKEASPWQGTVRARLHPFEYDIYVAEVLEIEGDGEDEETSDVENAGTDRMAFGVNFQEAERLDHLSMKGWAEGAVAVSPLGDFLYFASNRPGGAGGFDLYRVRQLGDGYGEVESLGPQINTASNELDPALDRSGYQLWFSRSDAGKEDLFISHSREVFITRESDGPYWSLAAVLNFLAGLIRLLPVDILALLVALLACIAAWLLLRKILRSPTALANALMIAILIHMVMAIWMKRNEVQRILLSAIEGEGAFVPFEVSVEGLPEEAVGYSIREAMAEPLMTSSMENMRTELRPRRAEFRKPDPSTPAKLREVEAEVEVEEFRGETNERVVESAIEILDSPPEPEDLASAWTSNDQPELEARKIEVPEDDSGVDPARMELRRASAPRHEREPASRAVRLTLKFDTPKAAERGSPSFSEPSLIEPSISESDFSAEVRVLPSEVDVALDPRATLPRRAKAAPAQSVEPGAPTEIRARRAPRRSRATRATEPSNDGSQLRALQVDDQIAKAARPSPQRLETTPSTLETTPADRAVHVASADRVEPREDAPTLDGREKGPSRFETSTEKEEGKKTVSLRSRSPLRRRPRPGSTGKARQRQLLANSAPDVHRQSVEKREHLEAKIVRSSVRSEGGGAIDIVKLSGESSESRFVPRIYRLRDRGMRAEALRRGGGSKETERAVEAGLLWLARHQSTDGRWSLREYARHLKNVSPRDLRHPGWNGRGNKSSLGGSGKAARGDTAATGLALLAFLGHGDSHMEEGPFRQTVSRGLAWLLSAQSGDGDLRGGGNLYMHGVAAFALCEAYAFTRDARLKDAAQRAINFTARSQHPVLGGWRYEPYPRGRDVDTSVFGWMLMALKSGKLGGLDVDEQCLLKSSRYLESARFSRQPGRYAYQPGQSRTSLAMTAQGFFSHLMLLDSLPSLEASSDRVRRSSQSTAYLLSNLPRAADMEGVNFYYWYYATLALYQIGGEPWRQWNTKLSQLLIEHQVGEEYGSAFGSWDPRGKRAEMAGRLYSTALSVLCLEVYYRYAPLR